MSSFGWFLVNCSFAFIWLVVGLLNTNWFLVLGAGVYAATLFLIDLPESRSSDDP